MRNEAEVEAHSRILDSEGWATMYGGGFSEMVLYSRVNYRYIVVSICLMAKASTHADIPVCSLREWPY